MGGKGHNRSIWTPVHHQEQCIPRLLLYQQGYVCIPQGSEPASAGLGTSQGVLLAYEEIKGVKDIFDPMRQDAEK